MRDLEVQTGPRHAPHARSVTVVIPTRGRESVSRAIRSVRLQRDCEPRIIVVWDGASEDRRLDRLRSASHGQGFEVVSTGGGRGGAHSRDLGVSVADSELVAFLDDDDYWATDRLVNALPHVSPNRILASRVIPIDAVTGKQGLPIPDDLYDGSVPLEEWLFRNRQLSAGRRMLQTSTLLMHRDLAAEVGWSSGHRRHEDWGFLLRAAQVEGIEIRQLPDAAVFMSVGSANSVTAGGSWEDSFRWMEDFSSTWADQTIADFIWGQPVRYALQTRRINDAFGLARRAAGYARPSFRCVALGASGLFGRSAFNAALFEHGRNRSRHDRRVGGSVISVAT